MKTIRDSRAMFGAGSAGLAAVICAIALAGCGGSVASVVDPVAQAATVSTRAPGYRMSFEATISSPALASPVTEIGQGSFNVHARTGSASLAMNVGDSPLLIQRLGGRIVRMDEVIDGLIVYVKLPAALSGRIAPGKPWLEVNLAQLASSAGVPGLSSLASNPAYSDPSQYLQYLRAASSGVVKVGTEPLRGVPTTHYRATIDLDRVPNALPSASRAQARVSIAALERLTALHALPSDVWIDAQHLVRRLRIAFTEHINGRSLSVAFQTDITQYGLQPVPAPPPADQVANLSDLARP